jgi:glucose-1-phosphate thymidylyltransferase
MIKKGIVLAGGSGTRMSPLTKAVNKQLLPIYDKPLIFYPLSILMLAKIKDVLIIVNKGQLDQYKKIIPDGKNLGMNIQYKEQSSPRGLPDAFILGEKFIGKDNVSLILGDNFFYGQNLTSKLLDCAKLKNGAKILLHSVQKPELFGVAKLNINNKIIQIKEKPKKFISDLAITGLYFFDNKVIEYAKKLKPSKRGELEIIDLIMKYKKRNKLTSDFIGRGGAWLDTGSIEDFYKTSAFVQAIEDRQGLKIACIEEIALLNKWIKKKEIDKQIKFYGNCQYSNYLKRLSNKTAGNT